MQAAHMDYLGETGDKEYTDMVEALSKDYLDWYILTQVRGSGLSIWVRVR